MATKGWTGFHPSDDPLRDPAALDDEDRVADEPAAVHYRRQADRILARLEDDAPPIDPGLRARLERELGGWERALAAEAIDDHWSSGEGDRRLF